MIWPKDRPQQEDLRNQRKAVIAKIFVCVLLSLLPKISLAEGQFQGIGQVGGFPWVTVPDDQMLQFMEDDHSLVTKRFSDSVRRQFYRWNMQPLVEKAKKDASFHFGAVNFRQMFREFEKVKFYVLTANDSAQVSRERPTDVYLRGKFIVILNRDFNSGSDLGKAGILLHTMLGAIGYNDENYQLTTAIHIASMCLNTTDLVGDENRNAVCNAIDFDRIFPQSRSSLRHGPETEGDHDVHFSKDAEKPFQVASGDGGGFTGVGGGGDHRAIALKVEIVGSSIPQWRSKILPADCNSQWKDANDYLRDFLPLKIEVSDSVSEVRFLSLPKDRSLKGFSALFPARVLNDQRETAEALLTIIKKVCAIKAGQS